MKIGKVFIAVCAGYIIIYGRTLHLIRYKR